MADERKIDNLNDIANSIRVHSIVSTSLHAKSGHPTSSCSAAEIMSVLFFDVMAYHVKKPRDPANDRFVLSKGHACPALYGAWVETGLISETDITKLRKVDSDLEGHPTPRLDFIDVATGSLGMGLSFAAGMAYLGKHIEKESKYRVFCLMGDGECAEGGVWEAFHFSSFYKLDNLCAVIDCNRLGQSDPTSIQHNTDVYKARITAFGWHCLVVDGHDVKALMAAFHEAEKTKNKPTCIVAKTFKGHGINGVADLMGWHGKPLGDKANKAIEEIKARIKNPTDHSIKPKEPSHSLPPSKFGGFKLSQPPNYSVGDKVATRNAYGTGLVNLGMGNKNFIALDGDVKNSTMSQTFQKQFPDRFIECYIAEQNMVGVAVGAATRDRVQAFVSTFAAFYSRAYDHIRMAAVCFSKVNFCGSHAGCSIGSDGPSQMALEDLAMFRAIPNCTVFYPSDAVSTERAVELAANYDGMTFIRTTRAATPVIYDASEKFEIGKAKIIRQTPKDRATVIACAVTLVEAIKAADELAKKSINIRVIDPFTIKPLDVDLVIESAKATGGHVVTVEDHYPQGGLGDAVSSALALERNTDVTKLAVNGIPRSGEPSELMGMFAIDAAAIVRTVEQLLK